MPIPSPTPVASPSSTVHIGPEWASVIISILAVVISIISIVCNYFQQRRERKTMLEAEHFRKTVSKYMLRSLPRARSEIGINQEGRLYACDSFEEALDEFKRSILYYKYANFDFYRRVSLAIFKVEDYVKSSQNISHVDSSIFESELTDKLRFLYEVCANYYYDASVKRKHNKSNRRINERTD